MDFVKVVVNGYLMDMEEVEPSPNDDLIQEDCIVVSNLEVGDEDKDEE